MKISRILALILALVMVFSLAACGAEKAPASGGASSGGEAKSYTIGINT